MLNFKGSENLHRIVVLNPKGGSGKTTLAFNIVGYLASTGRKVALVDMDKQGSSARWIRNRSPELAPIHLIESHYRGAKNAGQDQCIVVPKNIEYVVVDAPAALEARQLIDFTCGAHAILIPVLPSDIDIHAASRLISDLLLVAIVSRRKGRLGVVANRVNERTVAYRQLRRFLDSLSISVVGVLRNSQNYVHAAAKGSCIHELPRSQVRKDLEQWAAVTQWLDERLAMPLTSRDLLRPQEKPPLTEPVRRAFQRQTLAAAAAVAVVAMTAAWLWSIVSVTDIEQSGEPTYASEEISATERVAAAAFESPVPETHVQATEYLAESNVEKSGDLGDEFIERWQLSGIAHADGSSIVMLNDRHDHTSVSIGQDVQFNGWTVMDAGSDYAVFANDGKEVRLLLNDEESR